MISAPQRIRGATTWWDASGVLRHEVAGHMREAAEVMD